LYLLQYGYQYEGCTFSVNGAYCIVTLHVGGNMKHLQGLTSKTALLLAGAVLGFLLLLIIMPYWALALLGVAVIVAVLGKVCR